MKIKQQIKYLALILLALSMVLVAGCGNSDVEGKNKAMGRYVEESFAYPEGDVLLQRILPDNSIEVYVSDAKAKIEDSISLYHSANGEKWDKQELKWRLPNVPDSWAIMGSDSKQQLYVVQTSYPNQKITNTVYRVKADNALEKIDVKWQGNDRGIMVNKLIVADNGDLFMLQNGGSVAQYSSTGEYKTTYGGGENTPFTVSGNYIYYFSGSDSEITVANIETLKEEKTIASDNLGDSTSLGSGKEGSIYLYSPNGLFRLVQDGSIWEQLVDGKLTSMSSPSVSFYNFMEAADKVFYFQSGGETSSTLMRYRFDETVATVPEEELIVYSLQDSQVLQQAAVIFQRQYPDTRVNIQVPQQDGAATKSDLVRALNTELLQGKGPDVLLLDGLDVNVYADKGVLADVSDVLKDMDYTKTMLQNVVETYKTDKGIFAVPTKFSMPVMMVDPDQMGKITDLNSLVAYAQQNPKTGLIGDKSPEHLMKTFLPASAPYWYADGKINPEGLTEFLESMKKIADTPAKSMPANLELYKKMVGGDGEATLEELMPQFIENDELFHWAYGRSLVFCITLARYDDYMSPKAAISQRGKGEPIFLPGQVEKAFIPSDIVGVNKKTQQLDNAKNFLKVLLSDEVQKARLNDGFAVNLVGLAEGLEDSRYTYSVGMRGTYNEGEELQSGSPGRADKEKIIALCKQVKTPSLIDETLMEMIINEAKGYFSGEKDMAKTLADIEEKTKLYLSE